MKIEIKELYRNICESLTINCTASVLTNFSHLDDSFYFYPEVNFQIPEILNIIFKSLGAPTLQAGAASP